MGPDTYDVASLLRDRGVARILGEETELELVDYYADWRVHGLPARTELPQGERRSMRRRYFETLLQRSLKILGTFSKQPLTRGRMWYLDFIPPTLESIHRCIDELPEYGALASLLRRTSPSRRRVSERKGFMMAQHKITLLPGDGIGPEVTASRRCSIIECAGVDVEWEKYFVGAEAISRFGDPLPHDVLESILRNKVALKGPVTTPIGTGFSSINVRLRKTLDLYANLRPVEVDAEHQDALRERRPRRRAREHRGSLRRPRARGRAGRGGVDQDHHREGLARASRDSPSSTRARTGASGHGRAQGQHHEAVGRPLPATASARWRRIPEHRGRRQ